MSEYAKSIQTIEDMWKKRIELRDRGGGRMSEYIYASNGEPLANAHGEIALARHEIVRCGDCKYVTADQSDHDFHEPLWCSFHRMDVRTGGFCAWGEREDGDAR